MSDIWDRRWLGLTETAAAWGENGGIGVASLIVAPPDRLISLGVNGLVPGTIARTERLDPAQERGFWCEHSERAALYQALRNGARVEGATLYSSLHPCADCMRGIAMAGIRQIKITRRDLTGSPFAASIAVAGQIAAEVGITVTQIDCD